MRERSPTTPVHPTLASLSVELRALTESVDRLVISSDETKRALRGANGDIGLIASVQMLAKEVKAHIETERGCAIHEVTKMIYGDMVDPAKRGIVDDVEELKKWKASIKYWSVLAIGAIVVGLINTAIELLRNIPIK